MAVPVYSTQLFVATGTNPSAVWDTPAGFVTVLRDIDVVFDASLGGQTVTASVSGVLIWVVAIGASSLPGWEGWRGRQVCPYPGSVTVEMSGQGSFAASGYLLSLP